MTDITDARKLTDEVYNELTAIADEIVNKQSSDLDNIVKDLSKIDELTNEEIRKFMIQCSVESYKLSNYKEHTELKDACAQALYKESIANSYSTIPGTVEARKNKSLEDNMDKQLVSILYDNICERFKTKVDEAHRLANTLTNILISRASDAKLQYNPRSESNPFDDGFVTFH